MLLCDIGNTTATFYQNRKIWSYKIDEFRAWQPKETVYYINVNDSLSDKLRNPMFIDIQKQINFNTTYIGLGVDRAAACYSIDTGLVVDAGSAITMDVMSNGFHLGGFIMPGITTTLNSLKTISSRLNQTLNSQIDLECLPQKTNDAISYGVIKPIILLVEQLSNEKPIYFTGGDGEFLSRFFKNSIYDRALVFRGMEKAINENKEIFCLQ
ncbi:type III pantothenate kinase [Campylobacter fetus]|uniref:Type III pantothenate kinase n=3 Tax=Campylobacter fetus TaxID=196 RepID=A0A5L8KKC8_CAMFE|nr:type III pantothenate kinase [Campylobacter fetus]OCS22842.1 type III pantothenate kinase [Campylobacter fetus subsp. venerealis cfvi97/532]OCS26198.1 type III pantothenate kinase [Campylobacter fetus subsp. venerealis cfvB10]OCS29704.1 type III pantothenate kinase [Campylobacter fetus subsp. venerealis LMG 6570 = CCUG 33900]OCS42876.1 type III pantothenate kinase [Campylobacter fetus subsp. venerealis cfvi02/298]ABK82010.1 transcriptional activator, putative, Baf family [Campylobacter fetu